MLFFWHVFRYLCSVHKEWNFLHTYFIFTVIRQWDEDLREKNKYKDALAKVITKNNKHKIQSRLSMMVHYLKYIINCPGGICILKAKYKLAKKKYKKCMILYTIQYFNVQLK